jgi:hypothetical protein
MVQEDGSISLYGDHRPQSFQDSVASIRELDLLQGKRFYQPSPNPKPKGTIWDISGDVAVPIVIAAGGKGPR